MSLIGLSQVPPTSSTLQNDRGGEQIGFWRPILYTSFSVILQASRRGVFVTCHLQEVSINPPQIKQHCLCLCGQLLPSRAARQRSTQATRLVCTSEAPPSPQFCRLTSYLHAVCTQNSSFPSASRRHVGRRCFSKDGERTWENLTIHED